MGKLFIGNLDYAVRESDLREIFDSIGHISSIKVSTDQNGKSKGFGFVEFVSISDAHMAVNELSGYELKGRQISLSLATTRPTPVSRGSSGIRGFSASERHLSDYHKKKGLL